MLFNNQTFWNARLVDGINQYADDFYSIAVTDGKIQKIQKTGYMDPPNEGEDLAGATVVPGLIDAHMHILSSDMVRNPGFGPPAELKGGEPRMSELGYFVLAAMAQRVLEAGITTVRDVGGDALEGIALRQAVDLGVIPGPDIYSCGRIVSATSPGGHLFGPMYREADGADGMRKAVREQFRDGANFIKFMATGARSVERENPEPLQLTEHEVEAIIDEAHRMGYRVAAHAEGLEGAKIAVELGVDTIEHGLSLHRSPETLEAMARTGTVLVPTLTTFHDLAERFPDQFASRLVEQAKRQLEEAYLTLVAADKAGVTLAMGHDSGPPGDSAIEAVRMAEGGLGAKKALLAATSGSAAALGLNDRGRLNEGLRADFLVVSEDPLQNIRAINDPEKNVMVIQGGHIVKDNR